MKLYFVAIAISVGSAAAIVDTCMFKDSPVRHAPVNVAHLR